MLWLILLLLVVLLSVVAFVRHMSATHDTFQKMNIDSPPATLVVGNFNQAFQMGIFQWHLYLYNKYHDKKVYGVYDARTPNLIVKDLDMIRDILVKNFNTFVNRRVLIDVYGSFKQNLLFLKDDHWKHVRGIVTPTFSSGRIKRMSQHIDRHSKRLVDFVRVKYENNENVELKDLISNFTLDVIASTAFGLEINTMEHPDNLFATHAKECIKGRPWLIFIAFISQWLTKVLLWVGISFFPKESLDFFSKVIDSAMENRKEAGQAGKVNDFLDLLINADKEPGETEVNALTRDEIHGQALLFILGGYDTVSTVLSFTLFMLAQHPECCQKVQEEIDEKLRNDIPNYDNVQNLHYLDMCINETMRIYPPGFLLDRICNEDITIQGINIPKDMVVTIPLFAIHHDPEIWPEPDNFQPERFSAENKQARHPYAFLPFGQGPRNCIGMRLALVELRVTLAYILKAFTPVTCEKTVYPIKLSKIQLKAEEGLWVKFNMRK